MRSDMFFCGAAGCLAKSKAMVILLFAKAKNSETGRFWIFPDDPVADAEMLCVGEGADGCFFCC
jgi:hypothetical protein